MCICMTTCAHAGFPQCSVAVLSHVSPERTYNAPIALQSQVLVQQLTDYVDNFVGDCLADLPDQDRVSEPFTGLASPIGAFAAAVLKFKLESPACIKLLRRLLAALLPDNNSGQYSCCDSGYILLA